MSRTQEISVITAEHETLDFNDDDGKKVHMERTKAFITLPYSTLPEVVMLSGHQPLGTGTIALNVYVKKEQIRARVDVSTLKITKAAA